MPTKVNLVIDIKCLQATIKLGTSPAVTFNLHYRALVDILNSLELIMDVHLHIIGESALNEKDMNYISYKFPIKFWKDIKKYILSITKSHATKHYCINWCNDQNTSIVWKAIYNGRDLKFYRASYLYGCNKWKAISRSNGNISVNYSYQKFTNHSLMMYIFHILPYLIDYRKTDCIYILIESQYIYIGLCVKMEKLRLVLKQEDDSLISIDGTKLKPRGIYKLQELTADMVKLNDRISYDLTNVV